MLTDLEVDLLYEIYEITYRTNTVVSGGDGQSRLQPDFYSAGVTIRDRLNESIAAINLSPSQTTRVKELLAEFKDLSLDPSSIDQSGYRFRPMENIKVIRQRLYPYTGILFYKSKDNRLLRG